ncbi:MAG: lactonase family protein [Lyngbya sp. HA4199-MV5]|jgi:hypothetical protein|nr:lactonase family protein [Lyngbya sp. HA4199-MV5]
MKLLVSIASLSAIALIPISMQMTKANESKQVTQSPNFTGRYLAAISDGDFLASTYNDGKLPIAKTAIDQLSIIPLPFNRDRPSIAQIPISNSVTGAPHALSLSPDGKTAFVVETQGTPPPGATQRSELPDGQQLVAVDLSKPKQPKVLRTLAIAPKPETVHVHPNGELLAISTQTPGRELVLVPFKNGEFGKPQEFSLRQLGIQPDATRFQNGMVASFVQWHPSGRYLAVNLNYRDEVAFFEVQRDRGNLQLVPWGSPVKVGKDPFTGRFTPDGRFYLTSNWGRNFGEQIKTLEQRLPETRGTISVIALANARTPSNQTQHRVVSTATTDIAPEGITLSPDGSLVVTVNMRGTLFPQNSSRFTRESSLSLLTLDRQSGQLSKVGDYPFEGILPESAVFDVKGNYLAVAVYDYFTAKPEGGVEIWRVNRSSTPALQHTMQRIDVGRGAHQVVVAP